MLNVPELFSNLFSERSLIEVFKDKFSSARAKGIDRLDGFQFSTKAEVELKTASEKCLSGSYRFSPFLETLKLKGRGKAPRIISVPTIRDRVILHQLKELLVMTFPECVPRNTANIIVRQVTTELTSKDPHTTYICKCDIKDFYGSIRRERLLKTLKSRIKYKQAQSLFEDALSTPTVPKNTRRKEQHKYLTNKGVAQGLSISNILASIYVSKVDTEIQHLGVSYHRYVDDILIYGPGPLVINAHKSLKNRLRTRGLSIHPFGTEKSHLDILIKHFGFLGYWFEWPLVTVRNSTKERLLQSIAAKFSDYLHNKKHRLEKHRYLTDKRLIDIFLLELNERISGAICERKKYGFIAYFNQINDLALLHKLDSVVRYMFQRMPDFGFTAPPNLKKFSRAYFEMKFNPDGGYVHNYDLIITLEDKLRFLANRGRIADDELLTDEQINSKFNAYRQRILSQMQADEETFYR
jgi:RNA-directed DNA polymerase